MTAPWLIRVAAGVIPRRWRDAVTQDLDEERQVDRRGSMWLAARLLGVGLRMRFSLSGDTVAADLRGVIRSLMRAKGFTLAAVLTFALGIGANVAVFSVIDRLMFRPLPFGDPDRLVQIHDMAMKGTAAFAALPKETTSFLNAKAVSFEGVAWLQGYVQPTVPVPGENPLQLAPVTTNALDVLKIRPVMGRSLIETDSASARDLAVLLTYETWQSRFGGSDKVLTMTWGKPVRYRIVGVLPPGFVLPSSRFVEHLDGVYALVDSRGPEPGFITVAPFARLRPGVSVAKAQAELDVLLGDRAWGSAHLQEQFAKTKNRVIVQPLQSGLAMLVKPYLWLITGAVWVVLAVACVNLATLLVARGRSRQHEAAIRTAIGASPSRLIGIAMIEACVLCTIASVVALVVCTWVQGLIMTVVPPMLRGFAVTPLDPRVVVISLSVTFVTACLAAILPAINATRVNVVGVIQRKGSGGRVTSLRGGGTLLAVEAAFGVALIAAAAITVPRFVELLIKSPGFDPQDLYAMSVNHGGSLSPLEDSTGKELANRNVRARSILEAMRNVPHLEHAAVALRLPFGTRWPGAFWKTLGVDGSQWAIGTDFFETLRTPLHAGRSFTNEDIATRALVAIVDAPGADVLWPGESPGNVIGRKITTGDGERVVIGVSAHIRTQPGEPAEPALFVPITAREMRPSTSSWPVVVRMAAGAVPDRALFGARLNAQFGSGGAPRIQSVSEQLAPWLERPRFLGTLFGSLAAIALVVAIVGLYAVASFEATRRRFEMSVRVALGASGRDIRRRIFRVTIAPVLFGAAVGLASVWWIARAAQTLIPEFSERGPWTYALALGLMMSAAVLAAWLPARRASRADVAAVLHSV